ncbi:MAG TPA: transposase, partial [Candidatus Limihabitans stercoravium]|nr:transposase [Candidatus Limihabitans stercoravium]
MAKKGTKQRKYSAEFKISVILDMREHHLSYRETARKYNLVHQSMGVALYTLHRWERIYLEEGESGFMVERRGRKGGRPRKPFDKEIANDLIAENQRLKEQLQHTQMELEYLK